MFITHHIVCNSENVGYLECLKLKKMPSIKTYRYLLGWNMPTTGKYIECPVFRAPETLKKNVSPTNADLMTSYSWIHQTLLESPQNKAEQA